MVCHLLVYRAVKTFALIASQTKLDVKLTTPCSSASGVSTTVLQSIVAELCTFLRKSNRPLRQASLTALNTIIASHGSAVADENILSAVTEVWQGLTPLPLSMTTRWAACPPTQCWV